MGKLFLLSFTEIDLLNLVLKVLRDNLSSIDTLHISHIRVGVNKLYDEFKSNLENENWICKVDTKPWYSIIDDTDRDRIDIDIFCKLCVDYLNKEAKKDHVFVYNIDKKVIKNYKYR